MTMDITFVNIFIPTKLFFCPNGILFGYYRKDKNALNVNITAMTSLKLLSQINYDSEEISVLGTIDNMTDDEVDDHPIGYRDNGLNGDNNGQSIGQQFWCCLRFLNNELFLKNCLIDGQLIDEGMVTLIHYDTRDFMSSQLFGKEDNCDNRYIIE